MAHHVELHFSALTDKGMVRVQNEDAIAILPALGVAILADGMGGYRAGEVASRIAVDICTDTLENGLRDFDWGSGAERGERLQQLVRHAVVRANTAIHDAALQNPAQAGMGTTLVVTLMHHDRLIVAHVGDSRLYRLRELQLEQITRDHSQVQEQVDAGLISQAQARFAPNRNLVTRAMGIEPEVEVELHQFGMKAGDLYLLCSDGLSDMVDDTEIGELLRGVETGAQRAGEGGSASPALEQAASALVALANQLGGVDNISVVLIRVEACTADNPGLLGRILEWVR